MHYTKQGANWRKPRPFGSQSALICNSLAHYVLVIREDKGLRRD